MAERMGFARLAPHDMAVAAAEGKVTGKGIFSAFWEGRTLMPSLIVNEINLYEMHKHIAAEVGSSFPSRTGHALSRL